MPLRPIELADRGESDLAMSLNHQSEGLERRPIQKIRTTNPSRVARSYELRIDVYEAIVNVVEGRTPGDAFMTRSVEPLRGPRVESARFSSMNLVSSMRSMIEERVTDLSQNGQATGRLIWTSANALLARVARIPSPRPTQVVSVQGMTGDLPSLPEDVFAPMPVPIAVVEHRETARFDELPDDVFAPVATVNEQLATTSVAPAVNSVSVATEKTEIRSSAAQSPEAAPRVVRSGLDSGRLTQAVSLTRDAAVAWMKILSGPAVVTLTR
jgi:hypothetical protein